jgi:hypothetical protein
MSGPREIITAGNPATDLDMQRLADAAASADSLAAEAVFAFPAPISPSSYSKIVTPLMDEYQAGGSAFVPGLLIRPGTGGSAGKLLCNPARFAVSQANDAISTGSVQELLSVHSPGFGLSGLVPTNVLGTTRADLLYAVVQRGTSVSAARRTKSLISEQVSTQTVTLETVPQVTFVVATGAHLAPPSMPADTSTAWCIPLANLTTPSGYTSGTTYLQSNITQIWQRGWIAQNRVQGLVPGTLFGTTPGTLGKPDTLIDNVTSDAPMASRWGGRIQLAQLVKHTGASSSVIVLDSSIDWRFRKARIEVLIAADQGGHTYPEPSSSMTIGGAFASLSSGPIYTGNTTTMYTAVTPDPGDGNGARSMVFSCDSSGLYVVMNFAKIWGGNTGVYIEVTATDQFIF